MLTEYLLHSRLCQELGIMQWPKQHSPSPNEIMIQMDWAIHEAINICFVVVNVVEETNREGEGDAIGQGRGCVSCRDRGRPLWWVFAPTYLEWAVMALRCLRVRTQAVYLFHGCLPRRVSVYQAGPCEVAMWTDVRVEADSGSNQIGYFLYMSPPKLTGSWGWEGALLCEVDQGSGSLYFVTSAAPGMLSLSICSSTPSFIPAWGDEARNSGGQ